MICVLVTRRSPALLEGRLGLSTSPVFVLPESSGMVGVPLRDVMAASSPGGNEGVERRVESPCKPGGIDEMLVCLAGPSGGKCSSTREVLANNR